MALWVLQNNVKFNRNRTVTVLRKGKSIDDTQYDLVALRAAGAQLVPAATEATAQSALAIKQAKKGNIDDTDMSLPFYGAYTRTGQATATAAATTAVLTLSPAEKDALYTVSAVCVAGTGGPAAGSNRVLSIAKATGTVTLTLEAAPGGAATQTFDIVLTRT